MDGMLSQDEINALLAGMGAGDTPSEDSGTDTAAGFGDMDIENAGEELTDEQKDAVGEISNICMGSAATTLGTLLNQTVTITTPYVSYITWEELANSYDRPCVFLQINYIEGLDGNNVLVLKENDVKIITDLMLGGAGVASDDPISELHLSAIGEAMNQMMGTASTSMSSMLSKKIDISPPTAELVDLNESMIKGKLPEFLKRKFVKVSFKMLIGNLIDSEIMQLYPFDFAKSLYETFGMSNSSDSAPSEPEPPQPVQDNSAANQQMMNPQMMNPQMMGQPMMNPQMMGQPMMGGYMQPMMNPYGQTVMGTGYPQPMMGPQDAMNIQPAAFQPFNGDLLAANQKENIDLIMDVPLEVTVELGRTNKSIKDILEFAPGTIVELNKIAGEPIDVLVNGKYVAKGEVVVIEESFGVKITEIIK